jgi:metal-dependent amidase/aminoacylase/carboxypeptidase family protein
MLGIMGIHAQRETFKESDRIRIHPIMTKGGDMVNIVPADVHMETYVRGRNMEAVLDASHKVNRALKAGADAIGAEVEIKEIPGYLPLVQNKELNELISDNATKLIGEENVLKGYELMGATDAGDISSIIPFIHLSSGGYKGVAHSKDFEVCDEDAAYIIPAKSMAMSIIDLLYDDAELATKIIENHVPLYTKETYLDIWKEL